MTPTHAAADPNVAYVESTFGRCLDNLHAVLLRSRPEVIVYRTDAGRLHFQVTEYHGKPFAGPATYRDANVLARGYC